eukprot:10232733-Alexandrium_andersonii.AAC.1
MSGPGRPAISHRWHARPGTSHTWLPGLRIGLDSVVGERSASWGRSGHLEHAELHQTIRFRA